MTTLKLWQRYILRQFTSPFFFILFGLYFIYVLIDYSSHMQSFVRGKEIPFLDIAKYYLLHFFKRAHIFLPLALILSTIKTLLSLNAHGELIALQTAGLRIRKILSPIMISAAFCSLLVVGIEQYLSPYSLTYIDRFYDKYMKHAYSEKSKEPIHVLHLNDRSKLLYQFYDSCKECFFDVIWIRSSDDIWKMKTLKADPNLPLANFVDHITRTKNGALEKQESFPTLLMSELSWQKDLPRKGFIPFENRSITDLFSLLSQKKHLSSQETCEINTLLWFKLLVPCTCMLATLAPVPFCLSHRRDAPVFIIYALALFGLISFFALLDSMVILSSSGRISSIEGLLLPFTGLFTFFTYKFIKKS